MSLNQTFPDANLTQKSIYELNSITYRQVEELVAIVNPRFRRSKLSKLSAQLGKPVQKKSGQRLIEMYRQGYDYPMASIASRTASGNDLILTFTDTSFNSIVVDNMVKASNGTLGIVKSVGLGTMTISWLQTPSNTSATGFASGDFAVGGFTVDMGNVGNVLDRQSPLAIDPQPTRFTNVIGQIDGSVTLSFEDLNTKTWLPFNGMQYYSLSKLDYAMQQFLRAYDYRMLSDVAAVNDAQKPVSGSILWQIKTQGGIDRPFTSLTETEFLGAADEFRANGGYDGEKIVIVCGSGYLAELQKNVFKQFITTAGTTNTIGGASVKGINVKEYAYGGYEYQIIVDDFLDQPSWTPTTIYNQPSKRSYSAIWMSTSPVPSINGGMLPFISEHYFGNTADMVVQKVFGMIDDKGNYVNVGSNGKKNVTWNMTLDKVTQLANPAGCMFHYVSA